LAHAGEARNPYEDQTGTMGYSYSIDDQYMCFNAVNNYQLGWFAGQYADVIPNVSNYAGDTFVMNGVDFAGATGAANGKKIAVRVQNVYMEDTNVEYTAPNGTKLYTTEWGTRQVYIGFNYRISTTQGMNRDTTEYANRVLIFQKLTSNPTAYETSWLIGTLQANETYIFPNFDGLGQNHNLTINYVSVLNEDAVVQVNTTGFTSAPTPAPSLAPTPAPSSAPTPVCSVITVEVQTDNNPSDASCTIDVSGERECRTSDVSGEGSGRGLAT
jgi:hypothetical protein